jgi:hypothetical protein
LVFTSTAQIATKDGLISYATTPGSYSSQSIVQGVSASQLFVSEAQQGPLNLNYSLSGSEIDIDNPNGAPVFAPTTSTLAGTPVVNVDGTLNGIYNGQFTNAQGLFEYQITSLTLASDIPSPVPLPASAWLLVAGLGGLGVLARKRRAAFSAS